MVNIQIRKFHNQFKNGVNLNQNSNVFTHYLLGFVGQKMKHVTEVATSWRFEASSSNTVETIAGQPVYIRESGSWHDNGFQVGDTIDYQSAAIPVNNHTNTITNVTDLVMTADTNVTFSNKSTDVFVHGTTRLRGVNYQSNFIENDDPVGYISKVDSISDKKWTGEFTVAEFDNATVITATPSGTVQSWQMGSDLVTMVIIQKPLLANGYTQVLQVVEIFTITPFFDNISNLEAGIKPDYLAGAKSLKSITRFELLHTTLNPIIKHVLDDSETPDTNGNVGYYDEHFNGFTPVEFSKDTIEYVNASNEDKIVIDETTSITCKIDSDNNLLSQGDSQFQMNLIFLNEDIDNLDNIDNNFAFDTVFAVADGSTKGGENGIFSNVEGNVVANQLVVTADIDFSPAQQSLIEDGKYIIAIATNDHTADIDQSKLVNVLMDLNDFIKNNDIPGLMAVDTNLFYEHPHDKGTQGKTDFQGWVEDGILMSDDFTLDLSKSAVINSMNVRLMARNSVSGDDFEIATIPFDFAAAIISNGVQQIDIDSERGFKLEDDSQFNLVKVQTMARVGDIQHYDLDVGFKLQWMDWLALIEADPVFFDNTKINNGLNRLISNYSALNNYDIVMFIDAEVNNGEVNTNYRFISPALRTYEYDTDDTGDPSTKWVALTETFDQAANNLNANIHGTENTDVKVTFTALSGLISEAVLYGTIRLEEFQQGGLQAIFELSSFRGSVANNPLIPLPGETRTIFTTNVDNVVVECAIDFTKLNPASQYKISARLGTACDDDTGCAWESINSPVTTLLFGVDFTGSDIGLACGDGGTIVKTDDSGDTWTIKTSGTSVRLRDIFFADAAKVYCCGNDGTVIKSTDAGDTWADKSPATSISLFDLSFISDVIGWVCGAGGTILKTTDGGTVWTAQTIATSEFLNSIFFIDAATGWVVSSDGEIFTTGDGGATWTPQVSGVGAIEEIVFFDANLGWAISFNGEVLRTTNGGVLWTVVLTLASFQFRSIDFVDADNGITASAAGTIFRSADGGLTWNQESSGVTSKFFDSKVLSPTTGIAVGEDGSIVRYSCVGGGGGCGILDSGKLKEDGTQKFTESGNNKITE